MVNLDNLSFSKLKAYIAPLVIVLAVVLLVPFVFVPQVSKFKEMNLELKKTQARLATLKQKLIDLDKINENEESLKLLEAEKIVPSDKKIPNLLMGVSNIANEAGLMVSAMEINPGKVASESAKTATTSASENTSKTTGAKEPPKDKVVFKLDLEGDFSKFKDFLSLLEKSKRLLGIASIETENKEGSTHAYSLSIFTPFKKLESSGDIVANPLPVFTSKHQATFNLIMNFTDYMETEINEGATGATDPFK